MSFYIEWTYNAQAELMNLVSELFGTGKKFDLLIFTLSAFTTIIRSSIRPLASTGPVVYVLPVFMDSRELPPKGYQKHAHPRKHSPFL